MPPAPSSALLAAAMVSTSAAARDPARADATQARAIRIQMLRITPSAVPPTAGIENLVQLGNAGAAAEGLTGQAGRDRGELHGALERPAAEKGDRERAVVDVAGAGGVDRVDLVGGLADQLLALEPDRPDVAHGRDRDARSHFDQFDQAVLDFAARRDLGQEPLARHDHV